MLKWPKLCRRLEMRLYFDGSYESYGSWIVNRILVLPKTENTDERLNLLRLFWIQANIGSEGFNRNYSETSK